ncbi:dioxygenase family protein [Hydrogenovibrio kuenenii]|uniref:dioxygenase family protein n=1 Tax=Hydrogenovibrio kuenenii TaxID=63658 RepID=UPI000466B965|nr:class III extradiol ring-cleavage dioxygenase [Hydrogenovibrio kuenenii]
MTQKAPVMFVSHGAPTYALDPGKAGASLKQALPSFQDVKAVILLSAHWISNKQEVMSASHPTTIHDFGGFPDELYQIEYPAPGDTELAGQIQTVLKDAGIASTLNDSRGFDHGAWVPMLHLFPNATMPIVQISIDRHLTHQQLFQLGQTLKHLRGEGVAIIGSGSLTHNLRDVRWGETEALPYVLRFQQSIKQYLQSNDFDMLINHAEHIGDFNQAHPTDDHYLPLVFALGCVEETDTFEVLEGGIEFGALSMDSYLWH